MNKQEAVKSIRNKEILGLTTTYEDKRYNEGLITALSYIEQIDEPEKIVVPQFVADWYKDREHNLELYISNLCVNFQLHKEQLNDDFANWYSNFENEPIQTLVKMKLYGYEVWKEKFYTAKLKISDEYLRLDCNGVFGHFKVDREYILGGARAYWFTENDLVKYHIWENEAYEVNEVKE